MSDWDKIRKKIRELEVSFFPESPMSSAPPPTYTPDSSSGFNLQQQHLQNKLEGLEQGLFQESQGVRELNGKVNEILRQFENARKHWDEIAALRREGQGLEDKLSKLEAEVKRLREENESLKQNLSSEHSERKKEELGTAQLLDEKKALQDKILELEAKWHATLSRQEEDLKKAEQKSQALAQDLETQRGVEAKIEQERSTLSESLASQKALLAQELSRLEAQVAEQLQRFESMAEGIARRIQSRTQMTQGLLSDAEKKPEISENLRQDLLIAHELSQQIESTMEAFTALARRKPLHLAEWNVKAFCEEAIARVAEARVASAVHVNLSLPENCPALWIDAKLAMEAMEAVLQNAIEFSPAAGQVLVEVKVVEPGKIAFWIADSGPGVPDTMSDKLFEAFFTTRKGHQGLGLTTARRNLSLLGSTLKLFPGTSGGTVAEIILPAKTPS